MVTKAEHDDRQPQRGMPVRLRQKVQEVLLARRPDNQRRQYLHSTAVNPQPDHQAQTRVSLTGYKGISPGPSISERTPRTKGRYGAMQRLL